MSRLPLTQQNPDAEDDRTPAERDEDAQHEDEAYVDDRAAEDALTAAHDAREARVRAALKTTREIA